MKSIEVFLTEGKKLEANQNKIHSEKSQMDYQSIIRSELKDIKSKFIFVIDSNFRIEEFIANLKAII